MPRIPLVESTVSAPSSTGQSMIGRSPAEEAAESVSRLGANIAEAGFRRMEKQAKTSIYEAESELRDFSRTSFLEAQENRRGKNALPEGEYKGVYEEYVREADKRIGEKIKSLPAAFQGAASERLGRVRDGFKDRFAVWQHSQEEVHRKEVLRSNINQIQQTVYADMGLGMGMESLQDGISMVEELVREEARGGEVEAYLSQVKAEMTRNGLLSLAVADPTRAKELLTEVTDMLAPDQVEALSKTLDQKETDFLAERITGDLNASGLPYEAQMALVDDMTDDQDVKEKVVSQINWQKAQDERVKNVQQYEMIEGLYDQIFSKGESVSPQSLDTDPQYAVLDSGQKLMVKSWLKGDKAGEFEENERLERWYKARQEIIGLRMDPSEIMSKAGTDIDIRDVKSLITFAEKVRSEPNIRAADDYLQGIYPKVYKNETKRRKALFQIQQDVFGFQAINERFPSGAEMRTIVENVVEPDIDTDFQDFIFGMPVTASPSEKAYREFNPQAETARYLQDDPPSFIEKQVFAVRQMGYPEARFDSETGMIDLGVHDGYRYVITPDKQVFKRKEK